VKSPIGKVFHKLGKDTSDVWSTPQKEQKPELSGGKFEIDIGQFIM
jgi:hypothetical protein